MPIRDNRVVVESVLRRPYRVARWGVILAVLLFLPVEVFAGDYAVVRSLIVPGSGQAEQGHFLKASVFGGVAVVSAAGLIASQVQYNQSITNFRNEKRNYLALTNQLDSGQVVSRADLDQTYGAMQAAFNEADSRLTWRNTFLVGLIASYTINLVDILMSQPHDPDVALRYRVETDRDRVLLTRSFSF